jgi:hypothetical protein
VPVVLLLLRVLRVVHGREKANVHEKEDNKSQNWYVDDPCHDLGLGRRNGPVHVRGRDLGRL